MVSSSPATRAALERRPYQERIISKTLRKFSEGIRSVLVESPTGSGKTIMGLRVAQSLHQQGLRIGWVAMRRYLLAQAAAANEQMGFSLPCRYISMFDREPPTDVDVLIVDEAQHDAAASMAHLHNVIQPRYILGLSATPFRADGVRLCFDVIIRDAGIRQLIQDGYLSPFEHYTIPEYSPEHVVECYAREPSRWGKSILYFHKLSQCREAQSRLAKRGISADVVWGSSDREAQIESFREGRLRVLVNCLMLGEGFDCPDLETVFCRPSGRSVTVQACGRVLRKSTQVPLKRIVQCQGTRWPFFRTATPTNQFHAVEGVWRSLEANPQVQQLGQRMVQILARTNAEMPPFLGKRRTRQVGDRDLT